MPFNPRVKVLAYTAVSSAPEEYEWHKYPTQDVPELIEMAGRMCYQSWNRPRQETATNDGYIDNILKRGHYSVLRHGSVTFEISDISTALLGQLSRHKFLDLSVESARYVDKSGNDFVWPDSYLLLSDQCGTSIVDVVNSCIAAYSQVVSELTAAGLSRKQARQAARYILPQGISTRLVVTGNMQAWREFLSKRLSPGADDEIRLLAKIILRELYDIAPPVFVDLIENENLA
jgi:thymidylate synthase (FAD)